MRESYEEYMKRRMREEDAKYEDRKWEEHEKLLSYKKHIEQTFVDAENNKKIYESPDGGKTVYERDFGSTTRKQIKADMMEDGSLVFSVADESSKIKYKYNEPQLLNDFRNYIDATYGQHYSRDKFQATEFIMDGGHGTGFCIGNVLKYAQRYGKKGTQDDARKDLMKVLHYALLQLYVHDNDL